MILRFFSFFFFLLFFTCVHLKSDISCHVRGRGFSKARPVTVPYGSCYVMMYSNLTHYASYFTESPVFDHCETADGLITCFCNEASGHI